jgi:predicted transcriptional regulator of viral defense system
MLYFAIFGDINMKGLSSKEMQVISELEFNKMTFFNREDIKHHFTSKSSLRHTIHKLLEKKRIVSLNKNKYYLIPVKAKTGKWADDEFILADEIMNGENYFIGGWSAANYWRLTEQVPAKIEVYSLKRSGQKVILNTPFIFRKTSAKKFKQIVTKKIKGHSFKILNKEESKKWLSRRA